MAILYNMNQAVVVPDSVVPLRLSQGFTVAPVDVVPAAIAPETEGKINVNTCTAAELVALKGIGIKAANEIISGRPYDSLEPFLSDPRIAPHIPNLTV